MKTLYYFFSIIFLALLAGCTLEESIVPLPANSNQPGKNTSILNRMEFNTAIPVVQLIPASALQKGSNSYLSPRTSANHSANGHFSPLEDYPGTFSAMQNNGGIHGNAILNLPWAGIRLEIECLIVDENIAVIEGVITQLFYDYCGGCMVPGQYFSFEVIDNGEGQNAPPDQVASFVYWSDEPLCGELPPNSPDWGPLWDVAGQGDQIQVK